MNTRRLTRAATLVMAAALPLAASAFSECARPVKNLFLGLTSTDQRLYITFSDGGAPIYKSESQLTSGQMARFTAMAVATQTSGRRLAVRYPEDGVSCPPPAGSARGDVDGVWLRDD